MSLSVYNYYKEGKLFIIKPTEKRTLHNYTALIYKKHELIEKFAKKITTFDSFFVFFDSVFDYSCYLCIHII